MPAASWVVANPVGVWLVGPLFAALTGEPGCAMGCSDSVYDAGCSYRVCTMQLWDAATVCTMRAAATVRTMRDAATGCDGTMQLWDAGTVRDMQRCTWNSGP